MERTELSFRPMTSEDFPLVVEWLHQPHVAEWWDEPLDLAGLEVKYGPRVRGESPTRVYVTCLNVEPIGLIQTYRCSDYPEYEEAAGVQDAAGLDLFIGEATALGRGLGPSLIERFAREVVSPLYPDVEHCVASPSFRNIRSQHVFEKAGFRKLRTVTVPGEKDSETVFVLDR